jgi:ABC-2 type transport system permease protein
MPQWGQIIAMLSPLTYFTDLVRYTLQGNSYFPVLWDFIILLAFTVLFFVLAVELHKRTISQRI